MNTLADEGRLTALVSLLNEREKAKTVSAPEDNPYVNASLAEIAGTSDMPAINMATKVKTTGENPDVEDVEDSPAFQMEAARFKAREEGRADKSAKRMAQAKARAERKVEFDRIAESKVRPTQEQMDRAWMVVFHMVSIVTKMAKSKQRWANRLLGSAADDVPQMALEKMALVLAKQSKFDLDVLAVAAQELAASDKGIPGNQTVDENDPDERKQIRKARKWLMGMANNRVMGAVVDAYTSEKNLRWDNLDIIASVMASINGPGEDPLTNNFKASRAPAFLGTRFQRPDGIDPNALAMAITAAITEHGLDPMVEFLLDDDNRRVDGSVAWSRCAEAIFKLTPEGKGEWMWDAVVRATTGLKKDGTPWSMDRSRKARGDAARAHVRNLFEWMPHLIVSVVDSFDPHFIGWSTTGHRAILASDFELFYLPEAPEQRLVLQPSLKFGSAEEAAQALIEHLALLTTGNEFVAQAVNA